SGQAIPWMTRELSAIDREDLLLQALSKASQPLDGLGHLGPRQLVGNRHAHRSGDVFGARPAVAFLAATVLLRQQMSAVADVQQPDALGPLELVGTQADQIGPQGA